MTYILDAVRVSIGKANGQYKTVLPEELAAFLLKKLMVRNKISVDKISEIIVANAFGTGGNMARNALLLANYPENISAFTIDSQCSGGLKTIEIAHNYLNNDSSNYIIAGGLESKSLAPTKYYNTKDKRNKADDLPYQLAQFSPGQLSESPLIDAATNVALKYGITKAEMLDWTVNSHLKANISKDRKELLNYIENIQTTDSDQSIRPNLTLENLLSLQTDDLVDRTNTAHYNDAAALVLLTNILTKETENIKPKAKILCSVSVGFNPEFAPESVIDAFQQLLNQSDFKLGDIDLFEVNESFAVTPMILAQKFAIDHEKINVLGGNLAYGHPFGASGTINLIHLIAGLKSKNLKHGVVLVPAAGGLASAMLIENLDNDI